MRFDIEAMGVRAVEVRWFEPLGSRYSTVYRELEEDLEAIDGVESAKASRYSAYLKIATHVARSEDVLRDVRDVLEARFIDATTELIDRGLQSDQGAGR